MILYGTNPIAWSNDDDWTLGDHLTPRGLPRGLPQDRLRRHREGPQDARRGHRAEGEARRVRPALRRRLALDQPPRQRHRRPRSKALQAWIDFTSAAGGDHINACECSNTVHGNDKVPVNDRPIMTDAEWERFSTGYEELSRFAAEQGVKMGYHHHMGTIIESAADIDRFMAMAGPHTRLLLDTGHATFGGADPAEVARKYMDRVTHIHAKNIRPEIMQRGPRAEPLLPRGRPPRRLHRAGRPRGLRRLRAGAEDRRRARLLRLARDRGRAGQRGARALPLPEHGPQGAPRDGARSTGLDAARTPA